MTPEYWQRLQKLFHSALQYEESQRGVFLDEACSNDAELRREVEDMLKNYESEGGGNEFRNIFQVLQAAAAVAGSTVADSNDSALSSEKGKKYCPTCLCEYPKTQTECPQHGSRLLLIDRYGLVGCTFDNKYRLDELIGIGGMGAVYKAFHTGISKVVAVKILKPNDAPYGEETLARFDKEAKTAASLKHPNIVEVTDNGCAKVEINGHTCDIPYIVMECLEGQTLEDLLSAQGALSLKPNYRTSLQDKK